MAAAKTARKTAQSPTFRAGFLIASPQMGDRNFTRAVVLLCEHSELGAMGLVINRATELPLEQVLNDLEVEHPQPAEGSVLWGGPVRPSTGFLIYQTPRPDETDEREIRVGPSLRITGSRERLDQYARGDRSGPFYLCLGYSGWGPGQLEREIAEGSWIYSDVDEELIFHTRIEDRWGRAISSLGIDASMIWMQPVNE